MNRPDDGRKSDASSRPGERDSPNHSPNESGSAPFDPLQITRPERSLLKYYMITALLTGPLFPLAFLPLFFKYETLRYRFDADGVAMTWGILFRREVYLTYRRIQDIHLTRNLIQRWLGLANVSVQTASGSAMPEMVIEGISQADQLRDFLYSRMRGAERTRDERATPQHASTDHAMANSARDGGAAGQAGVDEVTELLTEIRDSLRAVARRSTGGSDRAGAGE